MRINLPIIAKEYLLQPNAALVSRTDTKGRITYVNPSFIEVSGFTAEELIGKAHNIVRHPEMPAEAFADMWETLGLGLPWTGMVKNRRKNGEFYWVQANVTPIRNDGTTVGYMSVRSTPSRAQVAAAESLYQSMREGKSAGLRLHRSELVRSGWREPVAWLRRIPVRRRSLAATSMAGALSLVLGLMGAWEVASLPAAPSWLPWAVALFSTTVGLSFIGMGLFFDLTVFRPLDKAKDVARIIAGGQLVKFEIRPQDEMRELLQALNQMSANLFALVGDIDASVVGVMAGSA
ncbi:methyl-accepting chemotaxis protein, partial [Variovorax ginsengisoli]